MELQCGRAMRILLPRASAENLFVQLFLRGARTRPANCRGGRAPCGVACAGARIRARIFRRTTRDAAAARGVPAAAAPSPRRSRKPARWNGGCERAARGNADRRHGHLIALLRERSGDGRRRAKRAQRRTRRRAAAAASCASGKFAAGAHDHRQPTARFCGGPPRCARIFAHAIRAGAVLRRPRAGRRGEAHFRCRRFLLAAKMRAQPQPLQSRPSWNG